MRHDDIGELLNQSDTREASTRDVSYKRLDRDSEIETSLDACQEVKVPASSKRWNWAAIQERIERNQKRPLEPHGVDCESGTPQFPEGWLYAPQAGKPSRPKGDTESANGTHNAWWLPSRATIPRDDDWKLFWAPATKQLHFLNTINGATEIITYEGPTALAAHAALEVALRSGRESTVAQLLEFNIDLSVKLSIGRERSTAIEWAINHGNLDLVRLFLSKMRVNDRDRVCATRALGVAVNARDHQVSKVMLSHGAHCDFRDGDQPLPNDPSRYSGCTFTDPSDPEGFMPPLVRAVMHGDIELVGMLLAHGADANVGYHGIGWHPYHSSNCACGPIDFSCGRVMQLAMELRFYEISLLLIKYGADVGLASPVWNAPGHKCEVVRRVTYLRVTAALRQISSAELESSAQRTPTRTLHVIDSL
jgi:serum/glucocorticoid-regulated kinase 2